MNLVMDIIEPPFLVVWGALSSWWFPAVCVAAGLVGAIVTRDAFGSVLAKLLTAARRAGSNARHRAGRKDRS